MVMTPNAQKLRVAAVMGFLAVALGALGAHGLKTSWQESFGLEEALYRIDVWKTASLYHIVHAIVLLLLAYVHPTAGQGRWIWNSFLSGIFVFSGSLYILCLTGIKWMGAITPIGGLFLLCGWLLLALTAGSRTKAKAV